MTLDLPFWVKQRQAKVEEIESQTYRITGPNLTEAVIGIRMTDDLRWQAWMRQKLDGPEFGTSSSTFETPREAMGVAFEMFRERYVN